MPPSSQQPGGWEYDGGGGGALGRGDVDLVNCFGMFEWPATLASVDELLPEMGPWVRWCTAQPDQVRLPCEAWFESNRGTGQGEPEGPLKAAVTIGHAAKQARADLVQQGYDELGPRW